MSGGEIIERREYRIVIHQEQIPTETLGGYKIDPKWHQLDRQGHMHTAAADTFSHVAIEGTWCEDCEEYHDEDWEYQCDECGAVIQPNYVWQPAGTITVPGRRSGQLITPNFTWELTSEDLDLLKIEGDTPEWLQQVRTRQPREIRWTEGPALPWTTMEPLTPEDLQRWGLGGDGS